MSESIKLNTQQKDSQLWATYQAKKAEISMLFPTEGAKLLQVSELALLLSSPNSRYMGSQCVSVLEKLADFGDLESIVRNDFAVHEKQGRYHNLKLSEKVGLMINVGGLDLRYFVKHWQHMLAVDDVSNPEKPSHSIQFFDEAGNAINKIFLRDLSQLNAWQALVETHINTASAEIELQRQQPKEAWQLHTLSDDDKKTLQDQWNNLKDIHQFHIVTKNLNVDRASSYHQAPQGMATQLQPTAVETMLNLVKESECPLMTFVGNTGVVQIQTGTVKNIKRMGDWLNILDKSHTQFTLHLKDNAIQQLWCVKRPTVDGIVTCIEAFDEKGNSIVTFFGQRAEGEQELASWRGVTETLEKQFALN